jgi:hypothetical protein
LACAKTSCGARLAQECSAKATQLDFDIPSVVPIVTDEEGRPRVDVQIKIDGELLTSRLEGFALPVDPGLHEFTFSAGNDVFARQKIVIAQGQRNRILPVSMPPSLDDLQNKAIADRMAPQAPPPPSTPPPAPHPPPSNAPEARGGRSVLPYVLGGVGLAGLAGGAMLTYWGRKDNEALAACAPNCSPSSVSHIRTMYLAADISFAAGGAALAGAVVLFFTSGSKSERKTGFDVAPTRSGAVATFSGAF